MIKENGNVVDFIDDKNGITLEVQSDKNGNHKFVYRVKDEKGNTIHRRSYYTDLEDTLDVFHKKGGMLSDKDFEVLVKNYDNYKQENSAKFHKVYEQNDPRLESGFVAIDEDGKVLTYTKPGRYDFLDTVDDEDGGFSRAVIFQSLEQAKNALDSFEMLGSGIKFLPVSEAFAFIENSEEKEEYVVIDLDGKVLSWLDERNVDFLDTVDDEDGGYKRAFKFDSVQEAKKAMERVEFKEEYEVLPVSEAFMFVEEDSMRKFDDFDDRHGKNNPHEHNDNYYFDKETETSSKDSINLLKVLWG